MWIYLNVGTNEYDIKSYVIYITNFHSKICVYTDRLIHRKGMDWVVYFAVWQFFRPLARNVVKVFSKPGVKKVLKTVGEEAVNAGGEVLIDSLRGNDVEKTLDTRINLAKKRIADSIEEGIKSRRSINKIGRYKHLNEEPPWDEEYEKDLLLKKKVPLQETKKRRARFSNKGKIRKAKTYKTVFD